MNIQKIFLGTVAIILAVLIAKLIKGSLLGGVIAIGLAVVGVRTIIKGLR
tara:strand:+ start:1230 stop:1379 length:150 start_codon:yes stop_codon:yes gene_type:complete